MSSSIYRIKTFKDIISYVVEVGGIAKDYSSTNATTLAQLKRIANSVYEEVLYHREWAERIETRFLTSTPKSTTGTVAVTEGSKEVTFSVGVVVDDSFKGQVLRINGTQEWYQIIAVHDAAARKVMLGSPYLRTTDMAAEYTMFRNVYGLWPNTGGIVSVVPTSNLIYTENSQLEPMTIEEYHTAMAASTMLELSRPTHYCVFGKENYDGTNLGGEYIAGYDFMENDDYNSNDKAIVFWPRIFEETTFQITYAKIAEPLVDETDEPILSIDKRKVIALGVLKEWTRSHEKNRGLASQYEKDYLIALARIAGEVDRTTQNARLSPITRRGRNRFAYRNYWPGSVDDL